MRLSHFINIFWSNFVLNQHQPAIRTFVQENNVSTTYYATQSQQIFKWQTFNDPKLKGKVLQTITNLDGDILGQWRYWQNKNGNWIRAKY